MGGVGFAWLVGWAGLLRRVFLGFSGVRRVDSLVVVC